MKTTIDHSNISFGKTFSLISLDILYLPIVYLSAPSPRERSSVNDCLFFPTSFVSVFSLFGMYILFLQLFSFSGFQVF